MMMLNGQSPPRPLIRLTESKPKLQLALPMKLQLGAPPALVPEEKVLEQCAEAA